MLMCVFRDGGLGLNSTPGVHKVHQPPNVEWGGGVNQNIKSVEKEIKFTLAK